MRAYLGVYFSGQRRRGARGARECGRYDLLCRGPCGVRARLRSDFGSVPAVRGSRTCFVCGVAIYGDYKSEITMTQNPSKTRACAMQCPAWNTNPHISFALPPGRVVAEREVRAYDAGPEETRCLSRGGVRKRLQASPMAIRLQQPSNRCFGTASTSEAAPTQAATQAAPASDQLT